jgi:hypothetical protein
MTTDNFWFYLQNRLIQTSQTGGQWYSDTSPFSIPWTGQWVQHDKAKELIWYQGDIEEVLLVPDVAEGVGHVRVEVVPTEAVLLRRRRPHLKFKFIEINSRGFEMASLEGPKTLGNVTYYKGT